MPAKRHNNFGLARLIFATLVVLSHSPELVDGNRSREILTRLFGTISFGEFAVDGFFLISGFLITKSFTSSTSYLVFLQKRIRRIYPGFIVAYLFCIIVIGPIAGWTFPEILELKSFVLATLKGLVTLGGPEVENIFHGVPVPSLNGTMWTIRYEFLCYLMTLALGLSGILHRKSLYTFLFGISIFASVLCNIYISHTTNVLLHNYLYNIARLIPIYLCGGLFYIWHENINYRFTTSILSAFLLILLLPIKNIPEFVLSIPGGYLLFYFVFHCKQEKLHAIGTDVDLSYGIYLYAWPVQNTLIYLFKGISPWVLFLASLTLASVLAYASWHIIERPFLRKRYAPRNPALATP